MRVSKVMRCRLLIEGTKGTYNQLHDKGNNLTLKSPLFQCSKDYFDSSTIVVDCDMFQLTANRCRQLQVSFHAVISNEWTSRKGGTRDVRAR